MADITPVLRRPDLVSEERLRRNIVDCLQGDAYCGPSVEKITQVTLSGARHAAAARVTRPRRRVALSLSRS
jgi:predicted transcriptional regulator of viral defense system